MQLHIKTISLDTHTDDTEQEYMISYQLHNTQCGNITGTLAQMKEYRDANAGSWKSYSVYLCKPQTIAGLSDLLPVNKKELF